MLKSHVFLESKNHRVRCAPPVRHCPAGPPARKRTRGGTSGSNRGPAPRTRGGTEAHKGRNRWFQQRPRSNDQGAASHCKISTEASGTEQFLQAGLYFLLPFGVDFLSPAELRKFDKGIGDRWDCQPIGPLPCSCGLKGQCDQWRRSLKFQNSHHGNFFGNNYITKMAISRQI